MKAIELNPSFQNPYRHLSFAYFSLGARLAKSFAEEGAAKSPQTLEIKYYDYATGDPVLRCSKFYTLEQLLELAMKNCNIAIGLDSRYSLAYFTRHQINKLLKRDKEAEEDLAIAKSIDSFVGEKK